MNEITEEEATEQEEGEGGGKRTHDNGTPGTKGRRRQAATGTQTHRGRRLASLPSQL